MLFYLLVFLVSLATTLLLTPAVRIFALKKGILDKPDDRKVHLKPIPILGGVAIYFGFLIAVIFGLLIANIFAIKINLIPIIGILSCSTLMLLVGVLDDVKGINAFTKFIFQLLIAGVAVYFGIQIEFVSNPFNGVFALGFLSIPLTLFWIVGITNAINLIDGLDGLATGITFIAGIALFVVALLLKMKGAALILAALGGGALGFLRYNFNPASIFLGDSGSLFLGFILAATSIMGVLKSTLVIAFVIPVLILGVPIFDTTSAIIRRVHLKRHIFHADKEHIHHSLLKAGLSQREVVLAIYLICIVLSAGSLIIASINSAESLIILGFILAAGIFGMVKVKRNIDRNISEQGEK